VSLAFREAGPADGPVALLVHGFPQSSYMWRDTLPALASAGWRVLAPDLAGFGDSPVDPPGTWERQVEALEGFRHELGVGRCVPVMHDWGALIGLRWACEHPDAVAALAISSSGFFPDGKWHGMAKALRTPEVGEQALGGLDRDGFAAVLRASSEAFDDDAIDEYWKSLADEAHRRNALDTAPGTSRSWPATASPTWTCPSCSCGAMATSSRRWRARTGSSASCPTRSWWSSRARATSSGTSTRSAARRR
jgi:haloalkane dehalogenase